MKEPKLVSDWKLVLFKAWSSRLILFSWLLLAAEQTLPLWHFLPHETRMFLPSWVFGVLPMISLALAAYARIIRQPKLEAKRNG